MEERERGESKIKGERRRRERKQKKERRRERDREAKERIDFILLYNENRSEQITHALYIPQILQ